MKHTKNSQNHERPNRRKAPTTTEIAERVVAALARAHLRDACDTVADVSALARTLQVRRLELQTVLRALEKEGYVCRSPEGPRLTLAGFALGVSLTPQSSAELAASAEAA